MSEQPKEALLTGHNTQMSKSERHLGPELVLGYKPGYATVGIYAGRIVMGQMPVAALQAQRMHQLMQTLVHQGKAIVWADSRLEAMVIEYLFRQVPQPTVAAPAE